MKTVFVLEHSYELEGCDEIKLIGTYSTKQKAESVIKKLQQQPGFCDKPNNFHIDEYEIDKDHWCEGFITV